MAMLWFVALGLIAGANGQELGPDEGCFSSSSVVGAVLGTLIVIFALEAGAYFLWRLYWRSRRGQHLVLVTDPEKGGEYAFDNPCFRDATPVAKAMLEAKEPTKMEHKHKWAAWTGLGGGLGAIRNNLGGQAAGAGAQAGHHGVHGEKRRAMDDSYATPPEPQMTQVSLRSHDFTGLGFNICGNMRDGIFVKDVLHRGPASESGCIFPGDRIHSIRISLRHMVFEDALTILSYASPYEVTLEVESGMAPTSRPSSLLRRERERENLASADRICHPFYRSQSIADLAQIGKSPQKRTHAIDTPVRHGSHPQHRAHSPAKSDSLSAHGIGTDYPTLKLNASLSPCSANKENARVERAAPHLSSTPVRDAAAVITPSSNMIVKPERNRRAPTKDPSSPTLSSPSDSLGRMQKLGVRVLPMLDPQDPAASKTFNAPEKHQNVHNLYLERGIDVPDNYHPFAQVGAKAANRTSAQSFDEVDLGGSEAQHQQAHPDETDGHTRGGVVAKDVKTKFTKGLLNLREKLHSMDRKKSSKAPAEEAVAADEAMEVEVPPAPVEEPKPAAPDSENEDAVMIRKPSGRGIPTEIPEEVRLAAMAARSNRKSLGTLSVDVDLDRDNAPSRNSSGSGDSPQDGAVPKRGNKRKAPRPPEELTPPIRSAESTPTKSELLNGSDSLDRSPSDDPDVLNSDSDCETEPAPRTTIELTASHITIHHSPVLAAEEETTRKAASLGDLSRIEMPAVTLLERAVSLDLVDGIPQSGKKRKAPPVPANTDDDLLSPELDDPINARKEPRLDGALSTFERRRLKKSSDWGTLEEALRQDVDVDPIIDARRKSREESGFDMSPAKEQVYVLSSPEVSASSDQDLGNSFFVGMKFSPDTHDQPFSFTATIDPAPQPLSIEVRSPQEKPQPESGTHSEPNPESKREERLLDSVEPLSIEVRHQPSGAWPGEQMDAPDTWPGERIEEAEVELDPRAIAERERVLWSLPGQDGHPQERAQDSRTVLCISPETQDVSPGPSSLTLVSSTPIHAPPHGFEALQSPLISSSDLAPRTTYVSTTQLNSLEESELPSRSDAFVTAVDSTLQDDDDSTPPELPTSPMPVASPMSSLTYITEIQVTTPDSASATLSNGVAMADSSERAMSPDDGADGATMGRGSNSSASSESEVKITPPKQNGSTNVSISSSPRSDRGRSTPTSPTTPKSGRNVSVTAIQGSRIPVRSTSQSPEDRTGRPARPPVPARRSGSGDFRAIPRKVLNLPVKNGVQVVSAEVKDVQ